MKNIYQLYNWFFLSSKCANTQISNCSNKLRVAPIKKCHKYEKLEIDSNHFAFAEKNKDSNIEFFHWLMNFLCIEKQGMPPIYIFDNHNHAITFWYNTIYSQKNKHANLIHIDQHSDCRENKNNLKLNWNKNELNSVFNFCNKKCNVWNFILPAIKSWIISNQIQIRSTTALQNLKINKKENLILDIDLDFCLSWITRNKINQESIKILKNTFNGLRKHTICTTIATSPYFLDQKVAINTIETILQI